MKNSIRFLSRALTGAFVMLTLLGHSLLGQMTSMSISYPERSIALAEGQEFSIVALLSWDPAGPANGDVSVTRVYEGLPTDLGITQGVTSADTSVTFSGLVIPELTGVSNEVTYILSYAEDLPDSTNIQSTRITFSIGTARPVDGELTSVSIDFPEENAQVSVTEPVWIQASVLPLSFSRNVSVDFFAEGYKINTTPVTSTNGYFDFRWDNHWVGNIRITARATLSNGTFLDSSPRRFRVMPVGSAPEIMIEAVDGTNDVIGGYNKAFTVHVNDSGSLVENVSLFVNGVAVSTVGRDSTYPFKFQYQMPQYGIIEVWAMADFSNGNRARTETLRYVLNTGSAPTVELLSPINGASFIPGSEIKVFATAYDADSLISSIDFFVNDTYVTSVGRMDDGTMKGSRDLFELNYMLPFAGEYRIFAQATDETGRTTRSNVAIVTAGSPDRSIPVVSMSIPVAPGGGSSSGSSSGSLSGIDSDLGGSASTTSSIGSDSVSVGVGSSFWLNAHAFDEDGSIRSVKFFANGQEIGETAIGYGDVYAYAFQTRSPGIFYVYAQATDNHGKVGQSAPVMITVETLKSPVPSIYLREIDAVYQDLPAALDPVIIYSEANVPSGSGTLSVYANGVLMGQFGARNGVVAGSITPLFVGSVWITVGIKDGNNVVLSNERILRVAPQSRNFEFVEFVRANFLGGMLYEEFLDDKISWNDGYYNAIVRGLDNGQRTRAEFIHELMMVDPSLRDQDSEDRPAMTYARLRNALMIRWALTGQWPTRAQMVSDGEMIRQLGAEDEGSGERRVVRLLLPAFQTRFFDGKRIPDSFSSKRDHEDFIKVLFDRKYGVSPTKAQLDRCVTILQMGGVEWFVRDFLLDNEGMQFGDGVLSLLLGIPNPPNDRLWRYADSASLFIGLLGIVPEQSDVESRSNLPLIEQIQIILDAMPEI